MGICCVWSPALFERMIVRCNFGHPVLIIATRAQVCEAEIRINRRSLTSDSVAAKRTCFVMYIFHSDAGKWLFRQLLSPFSFEGIMSPVLQNVPRRISALHPLHSAQTLAERRIPAGIRFRTGLPAAAWARTALYTAAFSRPENHGEFVLHV